MKITTIRGPFSFFGAEVEFATGLSLEGNTAVIGVGFQETEAWLVSVRLETLRRDLPEAVFVPAPETKSRRTRKPSRSKPGKGKRAFPSRTVYYTV
jgi:hypothetical protein